MMMAAAPLMLALFVAFAADPIGVHTAPRPGELAGYLLQAVAALAISASVQMAMGLGLSIAIRRRGHPTSSSRQLVHVATFLVQAMNLAVYTWLIHGLGWPIVVRRGMGLQGSLVLDELVILLPYLMAEVVGWWALYPAARASRMPATPSHPLAYLILKSRQTFGMVLPIVILFWVGDRLSRRAFPEWASTLPFRVGVTIGVGVLVVLIAPAFMRLACPSHTLPPGTLRDRLEGLARRFGFRSSQIRVMETQGTICNARIIGTLPHFRHVLLSDGLIDHLNDDEIEAIFAHEMGHIYHHHMLLIGLFGLGSIGVMALLNQGVEAAFSALGLMGPSPGGLVELIKAGLILGGVALYLRLVFGPISRRIEREADVFGCRAMSCGRPNCPPHVDSTDQPLHARPTIFCPVGIRIYASALGQVAERSGLDLEARDWRHGSYSRRVEFLRGLAGRPTTGTRLQREMLQLRMFVALALASALAFAVLTGAFEGAMRG